MSDSAEVNPAARRAAVGARRPFYRRRKSCPFSGPNAPKIDYKDVRLLSRSFRAVRGFAGNPNHRRPDDPEALNLRCASGGMRRRAKP